MSENLENKAVRGSISQIILKALSSGDKYGYEIIKDIENLTNGKLILKQPSLYSSLRRMEEQDLISSYWKDSDIGGKRHYYSLTEKGKEFYEENKKNWSNDDELINSLPVKEIDDFNEFTEFSTTENSASPTLVLNQENLFNLNRYNKEIKKIDAEKEAEKNENNKSFFQFDFFEQNIKFVKENSKSKQEITAFSNKFSNMDNQGVEIEPEKKEHISAYLKNNDNSQTKKNEIDKSESLNVQSTYQSKKIPTPVLKNDKKIFRKDIYSSDFLSSEEISNFDSNLVNTDILSNSNESTTNFKLQSSNKLATNDNTNTETFPIENAYENNFYALEPESISSHTENEISWDFESNYSDKNAIFSDSDYKSIIGKLYINSRLEDPYEKNKFQTFKEIFPHSQITNEDELEKQKIEQEEKQKERLNQILKSSEESNIDCEDIKKLNSLYNLQGIQIKVHSNQQNKKQAKRYTDKNKINMVCSWIVSSIMILELLFSFFILKDQHLYARNASLVYFLGVAITLSYCLISTFENIFDRFRLVIIEKSFRKSILQQIFIFILLIVAIFALNLVFGMTSLTEVDYLCFWLVPTLLAFNLPISSIIYYLLLRSKAYNS